MSKSEERLIGDLHRVAPSVLIHDVLPWFKSDEKRDQMSAYIENGTITNEQQLVVKILDEFMDY